MTIKAKFFGKYLISQSVGLDLLKTLTKTADSLNMNIVIDLDDVEYTSWTLEQLPATITYINRKEFEQYRGY